MTIWDRLAKLEGACEHEWVVDSDRGHRIDATLYKCSKCDKANFAITPQDLGPVGDGNNEEKYTLEELVFLAFRLGLHITHLSIMYDEHDNLAFAAVGNNPDNDEDCASRNEPFKRGEERMALRRSLATAILRAMGVAV